MQTYPAKQYPSRRPRPEYLILIALALSKLMPHYLIISTPPHNFQLWGHQIPTPVSKAQTQDPELAKQPASLAWLC